jgi:hypothetical protein
MKIADVVAEYLSARPAVAEMRRRGVRVGEPLPVVWEITPTEARYTARWELDQVTEIDETVIVAGDQILARDVLEGGYRVPPGVMTTEFVFELYQVA